MASYHTPLKGDILVIGDQLSKVLWVSEYLSQFGATMFITRKLRWYEKAIYWLKGTPKRIRRKLSTFLTTLTRKT